MEKMNIPTAEVVAHLLITWFPWLIGIAIGGGLGLLCALGARAVFSTRPAVRRPLVLLPWRTFLMGLLMAICSPFIVSRLGIGLITGGFVVAGAVSLLAMAFTATLLVERWFPSSLRVQLVGGARTLAIASGLFAAGTGSLAGGGLGPFVLEAARLLEHGLMLKGLLVILALALTLDLTLGLAQMIALQHSEHNGRSVAAKGSTA